jgi:hypothetical protein
VRPLSSRTPSTPVIEASSHASRAASVVTLLVSWTSSQAAARSQVAPGLGELLREVRHQPMDRAGATVSQIATASMSGAFTNL